MRVLIEPNGTSWICLETPPKPGQVSDQVTVECNSGADRCEVHVSTGWETMGEAELLGLIAAAARAQH